MKYVGRLSRTAESKIRRPPRESRRAHHPAKYISQRSMTGWNAEGGSLWGEKGSPRYFCGKAATEVPSVAATAVAISGTIFRGTKVVFEKFMVSPVALEKSLRIRFRLAAAEVSALIMIRVSAAY